MDAAAGLGRNPVSKHQIQPEHVDEQADAGRDCRTRLDQVTRRERGQGNIHVPCSADHVQVWQPYPVVPYSRYMCYHTYIPYTIRRHGVRPELIGSVVLKTVRVKIMGDVDAYPLSRNPDGSIFVRPSFPTPTIINIR